MLQITFEKGGRVKIDIIIQFLYFHKQGVLLIRYSKRDIKSLPGFKVMANLFLRAIAMALWLLKCKFCVLKIEYRENG